MCLEQMMCKLNSGLYLSARDFINDINLIRDNAVEYNPVTTEEGKVIEMKSILPLWIVFTYRTVFLRGNVIDSS